MGKPRNQAFTAVGIMTSDETAALMMDGMLDTPRVFDRRLGRLVRTVAVSSETCGQNNSISRVCHIRTRWPYVFNPAASGVAVDGGDEKSRVSRTRCSFGGKHAATMEAYDA